MKKRISTRMTPSDIDGLSRIAYQMKDNGRARSKALEYLLLKYRVVISVVSFDEDDFEYDEEIEVEKEIMTMASYTLDPVAHLNLINTSRELKLSQSQILGILIQHALEEEGV